MQARIFVIHSEKDLKILNRLIREYNEQTFGRTTLQIRFLDTLMKEHLGEDFGSKIQEEIDNSCLVIAIVSSNSMSSVWVNQEIGYAKGKDKKIIPIKEKSMAKEGLGFIHSNIDAQLFYERQRRFLKLNRFFERIFGGKKVDQVIKTPVMKPVKESYALSLRRVEPNVVQ